MSSSVLLVNNPAAAPPAIGIRFFIRLSTIPPDLPEDTEPPVGFGCGINIGLPSSSNTSSFPVVFVEVVLPYKISWTVGLL